MIEAVLKVLSEHIGKENAITSRHIAARLNVAPREVLDAVSQLREAGFLICAGGRGIFIAQNKEEVARTIQMLDNRALNTLKAKAHLKRNAEKIFGANGKQGSQLEMF